MIYYNYILDMPLANRFMQLIEFSPRNIQISLEEKKIEVERTQLCYAIIMNIERRHFDLHNNSFIFHSPNILYPYYHRCFMFNQ